MHMGMKYLQFILINKKEILMKQFCKSMEKN